jgi:hypothetical protein
VSGPLEYRPKFAPHVVGTYPPREWDEDEGEWGEQRVELACERCGQTHRVVCTSGRVRDQVARFALGHVHQDPFGTRVPKPGIGSEP